MALCPSLSRVCARGGGALKEWLKSISKDRVVFLLEMPIPIFGIVPEYKNLVVINNNSYFSLKMANLPNIFERNVLQ